MSWHCKQLPNGDSPIVVCERESLIWEINRLRLVVQQLAHGYGYNDRTVHRLIGVDPTGEVDEWPALPDYDVIELREGVSVPHSMSDIDANSPHG